MLTDTVHGIGLRLTRTAQDGRRGCRQAAMGVSVARRGADVIISLSLFFILDFPDFRVYSRVYGIISAGEAGWRF